MGGTVAAAVVGLVVGADWIVGADGGALQCTAKNMRKAGHGPHQAAQGALRPRGGGVDQDAETARRRATVGLPSASDAPLQRSELAKSAKSGLSPCKSFVEKAFGFASRSRDFLTTLDATPFVAAHQIVCDGAAGLLKRSQPRGGKCLAHSCCLPCVVEYEEVSLMGSDARECV